jgi:hypothetical protein
MRDGWSLHHLESIAHIQQRAPSVPVRYLGPGRLESRALLVPKHQGRNMDEPVRCSNYLINA